MSCPQTSVSSVTAQEPGCSSAHVAGEDLETWIEFMFPGAPLTHDGVTGNVTFRTLHDGPPSGQAAGLTDGL